MNKIYKYLIFISFSLLLILGIIEKDVFIRGGNIYWNSDKLPGWNAFRGYPNYLTEYDAEISSYFNYKILDDNFDSVSVETVMYPNHSWAKKTIRNSEYGLRHEHYHFNISEVTARKFRKAISELSKESLNKKTIKSLYYRYLRDLGRVQDKYDKDTQHSLLRERQKDWEYITDSLLNTLSYYSSPMVKFTTEKRKTSNYYRQIYLDPQSRINGKFPIDSVTAMASKHYTFSYLNNRLQKVEFWNRNNLATDERFGVSVINIQYNDNSVYWEFRDSTGNKSKDNEEVYAVKLVREPKKLTKFNLDKNGRLCEDVDGIAKYIWELDYKNRKLTGRIYNIENQQITDKEGFYIVKYKYDKNDNVIEYSNFDDKNRLSEIKNGVAFYSYTYDKRNNMTEVAAFDSKGKLHAYYDNSIAVTKNNYDLFGNVIRQSFYKSDGSIYVDKNRIAISYYSYDKFSNLSDERHYGTNKNLIISDDKVGRIKRKYDSLGNVIEISNYDAYDNFLNDNGGKCRVLCTYNKSNLLRNEEQYYADSLNLLHFLRLVQYNYDNRNNVLVAKFTDKKGLPLPDSSGLCTMRYSYDTNNNITEIKYYNENDSLQPYKQGVAVIRYKYDDHKNKTEIAYYDSSDNLTETDDHWAIERYKFNSRNLMTERCLYDANNSLVKNNNGVEIIRWDYNNNNKIIKESYFDKKGAITSNNNGIAFYEYSYDDNGNNTEIIFKTKESKLPVTENYGIAGIRYKYSHENKITETSYYDYENKLINLPEGYAIEKNIYDSYNKLVRTEYYSMFDQPVTTSFGYASIELEYDKNDNVIAKILRDENDELIGDKDGYAIYNWKYNRNGKILSCYGFSADNKNLEKIDFGLFMGTINDIYENTIYYNTSYKRTGLQTTYYSNGQKLSELMYIKGKPEGKYTTWYETGEIKSEIFYNNGMRNGKMIEYYKNGQKSREMEYKDNSYVSCSEKSWYENGNIRSEYRDGELLEWDVSGNLIEEQVNL